MKCLPLLLALSLLAGTSLAQSDDPAPKATLPVFPDGPAKGRNASYRAEHFTAWIDAQQRLFIQPTDGGAPVGPPLVCYARCSFVRSGRPLWREVVKITKPSKPTQQAAKVEWSGELEDGVDYTHSVEFSPKEVTVLVTFKDPSTAAVKDKPSRLLTWVRFPAMAGVERDSPPEKIAAQTAGCSLQYFPAGQKTPLTWPFEKALVEVVRGIERTESVGLWGPRRVVISTPPTKERGSTPAYAAGVLASYTKAPLFAGYYVGRHSVTRERDKRIIIAVQ